MFAGNDGIGWDYLEVKEPARPTANICINSSHGGGSNVAGARWKQGDIPLGTRAPLP